MDRLGRPSDRDWDRRSEWFWATHDRWLSRGDTPATALAGELEAVFCAGAWCSVIIVAYAIVEARLRRQELATARTGKLLDRDAIDADPGLTWLRMLRNSLVHAVPDAPPLTVDDLWARADEFERHARRAVELVFMGESPR